MFAVDDRDDLRDFVLGLAHADDRVVAGGLVGSLVEGGDQYSDLDLTFASADDASLVEVLDDWTTTLSRERDGIALVDLTAGPTTYRVFLFPKGLQLDLSMTPAAEFRPAGPRFRKLFGNTAPGEPGVRPQSVQSIFIPVPPVPGVLFGWAVIYALHALACVRRGRVWQAEHYIGAVRDHALTMACLRLGVPAVQARGFDDLPGELLAGRYEGTHVSSVETAVLHASLSASVTALLAEADDAHVELAGAIKDHLPAFE